METAIKCFKWLKTWKINLANLIHHSPVNPYGDTGQQLTEVMACCLAAPGHKLNQCWLQMAFLPMNPVQLQWKFPKYNLRTNPFLFQNFSNTGPYGAMTKHDMWEQVPFTSQHAQPILELTPATTHSLPASPVHAWVDTFHTSLSQNSDICSCVTILNSYLFLTPHLCHPHIMYKISP